MGDTRHKKSPPPTTEEEDVTDAFRKEVLEALEINGQANRLRRLKYGEPGYLICNRAQLADEIGMDRTLLNRTIGAARATSKLKPVNRSAWLQRIRDALHLAAVARVTVRASRADVVKFIAELPDDEFKTFEDEYKRWLRKHTSE